MSEYEAFVRDLGRTLAGRPIVLTLRDLTPGRKKYRGLNVRAVVSQPAKPGEPKLTLRSVVGIKHPQLCSVRIVEELPETFEGQAYSDLFDAMERAERGG